MLNHKTKPVFDSDDIELNKHLSLDFNTIDLVQNPQCNTSVRS